MTILDVNILLYAYNADAPQQAAAARWLGELLDSSETIALPWITIWGFIRISTNSRIWDRPKSADQAFSIIREWMEQPNVVVLNPGLRHCDILTTLVLNHQALGPMVTDAVLAALALENGAALASTDHDFRRFPDLRWVDPMDSQKLRH